MENTVLVPVLVPDPGSSLLLPGHSRTLDPRSSADAQESMKSKVTLKKLVEQVRGNRGR